LPAALFDQNQAAYAEDDGWVISFDFSRPVMTSPGDALRQCVGAIHPG